MKCTLKNDKDGKFYTEGKKFDCEEFVLTKDTLNLKIITT